MTIKIIKPDKPYDELSIYEREKYLDQITYLVDNGYISLDKNESLEELARRMAERDLSDFPELREL